MKDKGKETREREEGYMSPEDKGLPLDREETDVAHRKMVVYKSKGKPCVRMSWLLLIGHVN